MHANVGDRLVIKGHHVGDPDRDAEILAVKGANGEPPYIVRWSDDAHEGLFFPGSDAVVEHYPHAKRDRPEGEARALVIATGRSTRVASLAEFVLYANGQEGT